MSYQLQHKDGTARLGELTLPHGRVRTPAFMPIATIAALKGPLLRDAEAAAADMILSNTFHLLLRPGLDEIKAYGGLHKFMAWDKPILTDSGGYQVFSLSEMRKITAEGVSFSSPVDGSKLFMSPESATSAQHTIGSDVIMCFDECLAYPATEKQAQKSMELSLDWAKRCLATHQDFCARDDSDKTTAGQQLFGIVQGGVYPQLRKRCAAELINLGFDGYAIGGLAVGEPQAEMLEVVSYLDEILPAEQPRYLMGVGTPPDLVEAVARGIDMFDCVLPTRNARNGQLFTRYGVVKIRNAQYRGKQDPPQEGCPCHTCQNYSLGYLHHLFKCGEMSGPQLAAMHNLFYYQELMQEMRVAIKNGEFNTFREKFYADYSKIK